MNTIVIAETICLCMILNWNICMTLTENWEIFKKTYDKFYDANEDVFRRAIYKNNKDYIDNHNLRARNGEFTYELLLNQFGDLTEEEFSMIHLKMSPQHIHHHRNVKHKWSDNDIPDSIDWRDYGRVTPIANQGSCSSSWAFSATGAIEGLLSKSALIPLSAQNLIDCSLSYGTLGCNGGWVYNALNYVVANGGIDSEESYPYKGEVDSCNYNPYTIGGYCSGYVYVLEGDENDLKSACGKQGPISVTVDGNLKTFRFYSSGNYCDEECNPDNLNHAALVVGYGTNDNGTYWIIKNSWGTNWGNDGYMWMCRNQGNRCGIANEALYPFT